MKLIYIKSTMEPKNYSTIRYRSILKKEQGGKIAPYVFKINDTQTLQEYLDQEKITYEIYQEERILRRESRIMMYHYKTKGKNIWTKNLIRTNLLSISALLMRFLNTILMF